MKYILLVYFILTFFLIVNPQDFIAAETTKSEESAVYKSDPVRDQLLKMGNETLDALEKDPNNAALWHQNGKTMFALLGPLALREAAESLIKAVELDSTNPEYRKSLSDAYELFWNGKPYDKFKLPTETRPNYKDLEDQILVLLK